MDYDEIAAALFSGEYDHLTVAEFADKFRLSPPSFTEAPPAWKVIEVPVIDGVATLPDGSTVRSSTKVIRVPYLDPSAVGSAVAPTDPES